MGQRRASSWEGAQPGQLTQADQRGVPYKMTWCSETRGEEEDKHRNQHYVTITHAEALLSRKQLGICLPQGIKE